MDDRMRYWLLEIFERAERDGLYGELTFGLRKGVVTRVKREEVELAPAATNGQPVPVLDESKV